MIRFFMLCFTKIRLKQKQLIGNQNVYSTYQLKTEESQIVKILNTISLDRLKQKGQIKLQ